MFKLDLTGVADGTYVAPSTVGNMKVTSGDVNHVGGAIFPTLGPGLDLLGEGATGITDIGPAAAIPTPGIYQVSVTLRGSQRSETDTDTATVTFGSGSTGPITLASADPPQTFVFTVNTNSGDLLNIHHVSTDCRQHRPDPDRPRSVRLQSEPRRGLRRPGSGSPATGLLAAVTRSDA